MELIACMSGTRMAALVSPAITTVERPMHTMAQEAVRLLLEKIADISSKPEAVVLPAEMYIRGSQSPNNSYESQSVECKISLQFFITQVSGK